MKHRLRDLLSNQDGEIRPQLQALYHALATTDRPNTVTAWLGKSAAPAILGGLDPARQLTHRVLDELPPGKTVEHLRSVLVAIGTLPPRDEQLIRLNHWIARVIGERPGQRQLLHRYAVWHVIRRLRGRLGGTHATHGQVLAAQRIIKAAIALLDWLTAHDLTLAAARQGDLETWLASAQASHRTDAGNFVRWARKQKLTTMDFAAIRWGGPAGMIDTETRWEQARWLLHDDTLRPEDRVAGLLVLLYAQWPAAVSRLPPAISRPAQATSGSSWAASQSSSPSRSTPWSCRSPPPGTAMPPSAARKPPPGCFPAGSQDARSAPTSSPDDSVSSASTPGSPVPPRCSSSPPTCPPRCSPECSASTSASPSHGSAPRPGTGWPTPPTSAAAAPVPLSPRQTPGPPQPEGHSDSCNIRRRQRR